MGLFICFKRRVNKGKGGKNFGFLTGGKMYFNINTNIY